MRFSCIPLGLLSWLVLCRHTRAKLVNITIDDKHGDPKTGANVSYTPLDAWNDGAVCDSCTAHPDQFRMFYGTWHESTFNPAPGSNNYPNTTLTASVGFNGTAVYLFSALARTTESPAGYSDMSFYIDGALKGTFVKPAPGSAGFDYNVSVFSTTSLSPGFHTLLVQNGHVNGPKSLLILDSIVYTYDDGTSSESSSSSSLSYISHSKSVTIGVVMATVVVVALAGLAFFLYRRRRQRRINTTKKELAIDAFTVPPVRQSTMYGVQPNYPSSNLYPPQPSISDASNFTTGIAAVNNTFNSYPDVSSNSHWAEAEDAPPAYDYGEVGPSNGTQIRHQKGGRLHRP